MSLSTLKKLPHHWHTWYHKLGTAALEDVLTGKVQSVLATNKLRSPDCYADQAGACEAPEGYTSLLQPNVFYRKYLSLLTFEEAARRCGHDNGARLAEIRDQLSFCDTKEMAGLDDPPGIFFFGDSTNQPTTIPLYIPTRVYVFLNATSALSRSLIEGQSELRLHTSTS